MIVGHGIDIAELQSVEQRLASSEGDWIEGAFTVAEQEQADPPPNHFAYYAGRYAAKEAVAKALGTGFSGDVTWLDIEIVRLTTGAPDVRLSNGALQIARSKGISGWLLSISHSPSYAIASVIAVADGGGMPAMDL
jgi:holo-[acyl-carrier protein] synthase